MDGFELMRTLRRQPKFKDLPIIMLTSDQTQKAEAAVAMAGGTDIIRKPFIPIIVVKKVEQVLEMEYLHRNLKQEVHRQTQLAEERLAASERLFEETVMTLAKTIDAKDKYTIGHSVRVAKYSRMIAAKMGLSDKECENVYYYGLLHDLGKIGVPNAIINSPTKLTDEEYNVIKRHPGIGYDILSEIHSRPDLTIGARWHHERYDGKGYPDGLKGNAIPEEARIIAVADAYDAMTSYRSYRQPLTQEVVRMEIEKNRGTQFDPHFADIMLGMIGEDTDYAMREQ